MYSLQLPDPQKTASFGQSRETLESIVHGRPAQRFDILPPIRSYTMGQIAPLNCSDMERRISQSSCYTSSQSEHTPSRSVSPTALCSPGLSSHVTSSMLFHQPHANLDVGASRCAKCLAASDHVLVEAGKACHQCGTVAKSHARTRGSRRKRSDRRECLRLSADQKQSQKLNKEMVEAARRLKHTEAIGTMQEQMISINPNMPREAAGGPWKPLKKNNMSVDCENTLQHNKENIFATQLLVNDHNKQLLNDLVQSTSALHHEACSALQTRDPAALEAFVRRFAQDNVPQRIINSASARGTTCFLRPSQTGSLSCRL